MKLAYKFWIFIAATVLTVWACEKEYVAPTEEPNDILITTSFGNVSARLQVFGDMDFIDLSRGVVDRTWTFPDGSGIELLETENALTSSESVVKAAFTKAGTYEVKINQTFAGNVFLDGVATGNNTYDSTILVTVLDSVSANFEARRMEDNSILTNADGALNEIIAGREVVFVNRSVGEPSEFVWTVEASSGLTKIYDGDSIVHKFTAIDTYKVSLVASSNLGGDMIVFTDFVKVVPSTDPVDLLEVFRNEQNEIALRYSREMQNPFNCDPAAFTLDVTNGVNTIPVTIKAFSLDPVEKNIVIIELNEDLYNSDAVKVSYDASVGNLITTDFMEADSFSEEQLDHKSPNIMAIDGYDSGFENSTDANWPYSWWGGQWGEYKSSVTDAMSRSGEKSMYVEWNVQGGSIFDHRDDAGNPVTFPIEAGKKYQVGIWIYVEQLGNGDTADGWVPDLRFYPNDWSAEIGFFFNPDFTVGKWVYTTAEWNAGSTGDFFFHIRGYNGSSTVPMKFYLDDLTIVEVEDRP